MNNYYDYVWSKKLDLDIDELKKSSKELYNIVKYNFADGNEINSQNTLDNYIFNKYNTFLYPLPGYHKLFSEIKTMFYEIANPSKPYYLQSWLNIFNRGDYIDWHCHFQNKDCYHGFYCLDVEKEKSYTSYRIPDINEFNIESKNNLLVLGKSDTDLHRSSEWNCDTPRITIAFDIIPANITYRELNHWIPV